MTKYKTVKEQLRDAQWEATCLWIILEHLFLEFIKEKIKVDKQRTYEIRRAKDCNFNLVRMEGEGKETQVALFEYTLEQVGMRVTTSAETKVFVFGGRGNQKEFFPFIDSLFQ